MFQEGEFRAWSLKNGLSTGAANKYVYFLRQIDQSLGGLDEALSQKSESKVLDALRELDAPILAEYPSDAKSVLRKYLHFTGRKLGEDEDLLLAEDFREAVASVAFGYEREMQAAVRRQLNSLEPGLVEVDGGYERSVDTGRMDILAKDRNGQLVIIELKAGRCPSSALEQVMSYAHSMEQETNEKVRTILVASEFSERTLAAAKWLQRVELKLYEVSVAFRDAF